MGNNPGTIWITKSIPVLAVLEKSLMLRPQIKSRYSLDAKFYYICHMGHIEARQNILYNYFEVEYIGPIN